MFQSNGTTFMVMEKLNQIIGKICDGYKNIIKK